MATLYVAEYASLSQAKLAGTVIQAPDEPPLAEQTVAIGASSAVSSAFNVGTSLIRIHSDSVCSIAIGTNPTASAINQRFAAGQTEYKTVPKGQSYKIAVITNT